MHTEDIIDGLILGKKYIEFIQGICVKALQDIDDARYDKENNPYIKIIQTLITKEWYVMKLSILQSKVET